MNTRPACDPKLREEFRRLGFTDVEKLKFFPSGEDCLYFLSGWIDVSQVSKFLNGVNFFFTISHPQGGKSGHIEGIDVRPIKSDYDPDLLYRAGKSYWAFQAKLVPKQHMVLEVTIRLMQLHDDRVRTLN
jgi:hypothetical protein